MRIEEASALVTAVATARVQTLLAAWRVGQVLEAVVERVPDVGRATLNVSNQSVDITTPQPLTVGARLRLEITQIAPQVILRVLPPALPRRPVDDAIRTLLPRQPELAPLFARLTQLLAPPLATPPRAAPLGASPLPPPLPPGIAERLPAPVLELAREIMARVPTPGQIQTPDDLQRAVKNAGPFFERKLASALPAAQLGAELDTDLKSALLQLLAALRAPPARPTAPAAAPGAPPTPSTPRDRETPLPPPPRTTPPVGTEAIAALLQALDDDTDTALARVTLQQLLSLPKDDADAPQWILDLPVRHGERIDVFRLHIFREKQRRDARHPPAWCVRLSFDLVTLGAVDVLITWYARAVSVTLWAQRATTTRLFDAHLAELRARLGESGLTISHLRCETGAAPFAHDPVRALRARGLIDERA